MSDPTVYIGASVVAFGLGAALLRLINNGEIAALRAQRDLANSQLERNNRSLAALEARVKVLETQPQTGGAVVADLLAGIKQMVTANTATLGATGSTYWSGTMVTATPPSATIIGLGPTGPTGPS